MGIYTAYTAPYVKRVELRYRKGSDTVTKVVKFKVNSPVKHETYFALVGNWGKMESFVKAQYGAECTLVFFGEKS